MPEWARHNTTLPFTNFLAGAGDYTPVVFGERRKEISWARQARIDLAFLTAGHYDALVVKDEPGEAAAVKVEKTAIARGAAMTVDLRAGGGFIARFSPRN